MSSDSRNLCSAPAFALWQGNSLPRSLPLLTSVEWAYFFSPHLWLSYLFKRANSPARIISYDASIQCQEQGDCSLCCIVVTANLQRFADARAGKCNPEMLSLIELLGTLWHKQINYSFVLPDAHYLCIKGNRVASVSKELIRIDDCLLGCNTQAALSRLLTADGDPSCKLKLQLLWDWHKFCVNKVFINSKNSGTLMKWTHTLW